LTYVVSHGRAGQCKSERCDSPFPLLAALESPLELLAGAIVFGSFSADMLSRGAGVTSDPAGNLPSVRQAPDVILEGQSVRERASHSEDKRSRYNLVGLRVLLSATSGRELFTSESSRLSTKDSQRKALWQRRTYVSAGFNCLQLGGDTTPSAHLGKQRVRRRRRRRRPYRGCGTEGLRTPARQPRSPVRLLAVNGAQLVRLQRPSCGSQEAIVIRNG
jgi:hypothetical protein